MELREYNEFLIEVLNGCENQEQANIILSSMEQSDVNDLMKYVINEMKK